VALTAEFCGNPRISEHGQFRDSLRGPTGLLASNDLRVALVKQDHNRKQSKQSHCQVWLPAFRQSQQVGSDSRHFAITGLSSPSTLRNNGMRTRRIHAGLTKQQTRRVAQADLSCVLSRREGKECSRVCPQAHSVDISTMPAHPPSDGTPTVRWKQNDIAVLELWLLFGNISASPVAVA
jgi:hypothetical protein